jgi:aminoglycoside phosphotransferase (APT) family kinase protein
MKDAGTALTELQSALEAFLRAQGHADASVEGLRALAGGASRRLYEFRLRLGGSVDERLVLRMDSDGGILPSRLDREFGVLAAALSAGVPVPAPRWQGCATDGLGASFIIIGWSVGQAIPRPLLREPQFAAARAALPEQLARALARIHAIALDDDRLAALRSDAADGVAARAETRRYAELYRSIAAEPQPVLELAQRWLEREAPETGRTTLVHGDFRVGNFLYDTSGLVAVLDWELAHVGDPMEDVGWLAVAAWRFGAEDRAVGGLCSRERFWKLYEQAGGSRVDPARARYWEIFGNWKWAIICMLQAARHRVGERRDVELASLGRRLAEIEWELLGLLEEADQRAGGSAESSSAG